MSNTTKYVTPPSVQLHSVRKVETQQVIHQNPEREPWICTRINFRDVDGQIVFCISLFGEDGKGEVEFITHSTRNAVYY
jgi:hypothetical protein